MISQNTAEAYGCSGIMNKPNIKHKKKDIIRRISILEITDFSANAMVININRGPHAHHSPHNDAGDATLK